MKSVHRSVAWGGAVRFATGCSKYLGWILAEELTPNERVLEILSSHPGDPEYVREERKRRTPYRIRVIELAREVHESDRYELGSDYRRNDSFYFRTRKEAEAFLLTQGVAVQDLRSPRELDVP